jgi:CheY-like chemotaxis protein
VGSAAESDASDDTRSIQSNPAAWRDELQPIVELAGRHVLIVEDEYLIAQEMVCQFRAAGAEVVGPVATVRGALELVKKAVRLDGAVIDINLRGEMAYPVADALVRRGIPLVIATGYDVNTLPARYDGLPACEKPIDVQRVARALFG